MTLTDMRIVNETIHRIFALSSHRATQAKLPSLRRLMRCERPDISATYEKKSKSKLMIRGDEPPEYLSTRFKDIQSISKDI